MKQVLASRRATVEDAKDDVDDNDDCDATVVMMAELTEDDEDVDTDFDPKDLLGKILTFINQVCSSPWALTYFCKLCLKEKLKPLQLLKWVQTRWASLYDLISHLIEVQPACNLEYKRFYMANLLNRPVQSSPFSLTSHWKYLISLVTNHMAYSN